MKMAECAKKTGYSEADLLRAEDGVRTAMEKLELDEEHWPTAELNLQDTPGRIVRYWADATSGAHMLKPEVRVFQSAHDQILLVKGIDFTSLCSHHFLPFFGRASFAYIPDGKVLGVSKPARVVDYFAAQPQTQEKLTKEVADFLQAELRAKGIAVVLEAVHTCIACRGAHKANASFVTSKLLGVFETDAKARSEVLDLING